MDNMFFLQEFLRNKTEKELELIRLMVAQRKKIVESKKRRSYFLEKHRIRKFRHFTANESNVGGKCAICLSDFEVGNQLVELNCEGKHLLCKVCTDKWFSEHNKCPKC